MPPEGGMPESTHLWLRRARSNLARAKAPKPAEALWEDLCFDAQQAVEKALKAVLVSKWVRPPKTHDIAQLIALLADHGWRRKPTLRRRQDSAAMRWMPVTQAPWKPLGRSIGRPSPLPNGWSGGLKNR